MALLYFLQHDLRPLYEQALSTASKDAVRQALSYCIAQSDLDEIARLLAHPKCMVSRNDLLSFLTFAPPAAFQIVLDRVTVQFQAPDIDAVIFPLHILPIAYPESLRILLRHKCFSNIAYTVTAHTIPAATFPRGWGVADFLLEQEARKAACNEILAQERRRIRAQNMRSIFWATILLIRIREFQARYWGEGGKGYCASKQRFESALATATAAGTV